MKFLKQSLVAASVITVIANLLSRFFGYFREAINANYFGTSQGMDIFIIAFTVPEIVASVAFMSIPPAIIPLLKNQDLDGDFDDSRNFWSGLYLFSLIFFLLASAIYLFRFQILDLLAPDENSGMTDLGGTILAISSGYIFFRGLETYFRSWLFSKKHFIIPAFSNIILNIVIILSVLSFYEKINIISLAIGWLLASFAICLINGFYAFRVVIPKFTLNIAYNWINIVAKSIFAVCIIELIATLFLIIDRYLAANYLGTGEIAGLRYALIIVTIPMAVVAAAYNTASFPWISDMIQREELASIAKFIRKSTNILLYVVGFISVFMVLFPEGIVILAFQRGAFDINSMELTSAPLRYYAIGLVFHAIYIFLIRFYYAKRKLLRLGIILFVVLNIKLIFSIILINYFDNEGLALATSIARFFGFILIAFDVRREVEISISDLISKSSVKIIVLLLLMIIYFVGILKILPPSLDYGFIIGLIRISLIFGSGALLYLIMGYLINIEETRYLVGLLTKKILTKRE